MVEQQNGSSYTQIVYNVDGSKVALMNGQNLTKAYVPLPGGATAVYNSSGLAYFEHPDWLGTSRLASSPSRTVLWDGAYAPFGDSYSESPANYAYHNFTGQREDTVQGLSDFMFREYSVGQQGRWISPDPAGLAAVDITNPQTWNRYAYVGNSPLDSVDDNGLCSIGVAGINTPNANNSPGSYYFWNAWSAMNGTVALFPYGPGTGVGVGNVVGGDIGVSDLTQGLVQATEAASGDPNGIQWYGTSGGAQVMANAYAALPPNIQSQITFIGYFSPGIGALTAFSGLPSGTMGSFSAHGHGWKDFAATFWARVTGQAGMALPCGHDVQCEYETAPINLAQQVTPCPKQQFGRGGWGGGNFFSATGVVPNWQMGTSSIFDGTEYMGEYVFWIDTSNSGPWTFIQRK
jgi:RHS repeat-associated protein